ncbi:hypothetical protein [Shivajiella indica]|uniref:Outer membrane protein beta-barrel domain-containing protein n=1 Tax=Shivajiella indica TaxID=872115 RepID=A0ABW5B982_9BACT
MRIKIAILLFLLPLAGKSQFFGLGFQTNLGIPVLDLRDEVGGLVFPEFNTLGIYKFTTIPIEVGLSVGYGVYNTSLEKRRDLYPGYNDELRLRRNNNLLTVMGMFRYFPEVKRTAILPFIEIQAGANYFYTRYKIRESRFDDPIEEGRDFSDWVAALRFGGGLKIPFKKAESGYFEFKILYHESGKVEFLRKNDTQYLPDQGDGEFVYSPISSQIKMIQPGIGVILYMNPSDY